MLGSLAQEEAGDVLHYIDFHQLQIENKQSVATLDELNGGLLRLKQSGGAVALELTALKEVSTHPFIPKLTEGTS